MTPIPRCERFVNLSFRRSRSTARALKAHTSSEMVCLAHEGKLRLAHEASARKLATTAGSAFVEPIDVKSCPRFRASLSISKKNVAALGLRRPVGDKQRG